jgi:hypothetical protein
MYLTRVPIMAVAAYVGVAVLIAGQRRCVLGQAARGAVAETGPQGATPHARPARRDRYPPLKVPGMGFEPQRSRVSQDKDKW